MNWSIIMDLTLEDKEIVKRAKREQFRQLLTDYIEYKKEETKAGIVSWMNADMSKSKRTDRVLLLYKLEVLDEVMNFPDEIINLVDNLEYTDQ